MKQFFIYACVLAFIFIIGCKKSNNINNPNTPVVNLPQWFKDRGLEGKATWDSASATLRITSNVNWGGDNDLETFYFQAPLVVKTIIIAANVTVTGGFRADHRMTIRGESRETSVIFGTNTDAWSLGPNKTQDSPNCNTAGGDDRAPDCKKWEYSAISAKNLPAADTLFVSTLTIKNARAYNITSITNPIKVDNVYMVELRAVEGNSNCDGFGAGAGSSITNSTIEVTDDAIKLYRGMTVKNVTIKLRRNGAPFQLGWGGEPTSTHTIENVLVTGMDSQNRYNCGLFSWKSGTANTTRTIDISGLKTQNLQAAQIWSGSAWVNNGLFEIRSANAVLSINAVNTSIQYSTIAFPAATGTVNATICGSATLSNSYSCGTGNAVTGNN